MSGFPAIQSASTFRSYRHHFIIGGMVIKAMLKPARDFLLFADTRFLHGLLNFGSGAHGLTITDGQVTIKIAGGRR
jgi:hypothetical protein